MNVYGFKFTENEPEQYYITSIIYSSEDDLTSFSQNFFNLAPSSEFYDGLVFGTPEASDRFTYLKSRPYLRYLNLE